MENQVSELSQEDVNLIADYVKLCHSSHKAMPNIKVILGEDSAEMTLRDFDFWMERELLESEVAPGDQFIKELIPSDENLPARNAFKFDLTNKTREELLAHLKDLDLLFGDNGLFPYVDYYIRVAADHSPAGADQIRANLERTEGKKN